MFDADSLWNPYADSRIVHRDPGHEVLSVMWGIDINTPELLLADRLREKGRRIDAVTGHHPGRRPPACIRWCISGEHDGVVGRPSSPPPSASWAPRAREVMCGTHAGNHMQAGDSAALLGIPLMCLHQPADLLARAS